MVLVSVGETAASLRNHVQFFLERQWALPDTLLEILSLQELHRHVWRTFIVVAEVVYRDDVRVL